MEVDLQQSSPTEASSSPPRLNCVERGWNLGCSTFYGAAAHRLRASRPASLYWPSDGTRSKPVPTCAEGGCQASHREPPRSSVSRPGPDAGCRFEVRG